MLADDHPLVLEGLRSFLSPLIECVGAVGDGRTLVDEAVRLHPDLVILDITMPLMNGIEAAAHIHKELPGVKLLFVTSHTTYMFLEAALNAGASGYVVKTAPREELLEAVSAVLGGHVFISPCLCGENIRAAAASHLSARERETLQLIAEGRSAKQIAYLMNISIKTVEFHRENLKRKLGLRTIAELTRHAIEEGMV